MERVEMVTNPQGRKISMRSTEEADYDDPSGKTGPLKCNKGFTVRARLTQAAEGRTSWSTETVALVADQIPVGEYSD